MRTVSLNDELALELGALIDERGQAARADEPELELAIAGIG